MHKSFYLFQLLIHLVFSYNLQISFLILGKAVIPLLPESFYIFGSLIEITLMRAIIVIAIITGIYITFGGQTAVIFTDLLQGFILLFAGFLLFVLGISYVGGGQEFWDLLPLSWKLPLADFNKPSSFNFVGIFWQDAVAGSIGFLFMNQGLLMRFMACKSVNEGRKAATINILFVLPLSAIVVGNAGWLGKAMSVMDPNIVSPNTSPDEIFVVVASIVTSPGIFGFIMAALTAALMSTVDTLINATAAIFVNDVYRPIMKYLKKIYANDNQKDKEELFAARISSMAITVAGVLSVLAFIQFPTVYEAHGYFHSTLTPPLVVAIFMGVFWKRFTPAGVITTFLGGVVLMILGARFPEIFISPFDHGIEMNPDRPYSYIRAFYNLIACVGVGVFVTMTTSFQHKIVSVIKKNKNSNTIMLVVSLIASIIFILVILGSSAFQFIFPVFIIVLVPIIVTYYGKYDEELSTKGLTVYSINEAKKAFKGSELNETHGEQVEVKLQVSNHYEDKIMCSKNDLLRLGAEVGDLVYLSDKRKWLGGLKSIHSRFGKSHNEDGIVYLNKDQIEHGLFDKNKILIAEKEM